MSSVTTFASVFLLFFSWGGVSANEPASSSTDEGCSFDFTFEGDTGPSKWGSFCPACNGNQQSPINIDTSIVVKKDYPEVDGSFRQNNDQLYTFSVTNDGYTVTVKLMNSSTLNLEGGPLKGLFILKQLQFCWGANDSVGSEHTFNGERFPLESQWGFYNAKYSSYEEASNYPDGIFILVELYRIKKEDNPSMATIIRTFSSVTQPGEVANPEELLNYKTILSGNENFEFYSYNGSFTTPPCSEVVTWLIYPPLNGVSSSQMAEFRKLQGPNGPLVNNFRPLQPLNGRTIVTDIKNTQTSTQGGS